MKLSIIIPLYNKEKYIDRCLKSLLAQDLSSNEYEIIIIDDGSKDSGGLIAQDYSEQYSNIQVFSQENRGVSATRNRGIEIARGKYVYLMDADDYLARTTLGNLLNICESNNLEILGFNTTYTENGNLTRSSTENPKNLSVKVVDGVRFIGESSYRNEAWWYVIEREFLLNSGIKFIEGRLLEDAIFTASLFLKSKRIAKVDYDIHRFVKVQNSIQTSTNTKHLRKFIYDLVFAIEEIDDMINNLDSSHVYYQKVVRDFRKKQQSFVFTLFIKVFRHPFFSLKELGKILKKLKGLNVYPINLETGGIGNKKSRFIYSMTFVPVFNSRNLLFLCLNIKRLVGH